MSATPESYPRRRGMPADLSEWEVGDEHVAESCEQGEIIEVFRASLEQLAKRRRWKRVLVAADNYFAWIRRQPQVRVAPDVYLLDNPPEKHPKMWETWRPGHSPPRWALEIVSENWRKDYVEDPAKYEALGSRELVVFDPDASMGRTCDPRRVPLTVHRRTAAGELAVVYAGPGPAFSRELRAWLVPGHEGYAARLRLSEDRAGARLVPTFEEGQEAERKAKEAERKEKEAERKEKEAERKEKEAERKAKEAERARRRAAERATAKAEKATARAEKARDEAQRRAAELERELRKKPR